MGARVHIFAAAILAVTLAGCGGGVATILAALGIIKLHDIYTDVTDEISDNPEDTLVLLLDGYTVRSDVPNRQGRLQLGGLPEGTFLLSLLSPDYRRGWHHLVTIGQTDRIEINPFTGAIISGSVSRQATGGGQLRVANALVLAFRDGAARIVDTAGPLRPGDENVEYLVGITDAAGTFKLGPAAYGSWLVIAVLPGYKADARIVAVSAEDDATGLALLLEADTDAQTATVQGTVAREKGGTPLQAALVRADLHTPYIPAISDNAWQRVVDEFGQDIPADNWVALPFVCAVTDAAGVYTLRLPAGDARVWAYKYGYKGVYTDISAEPGSAISQDFRLKD